MKMKKLLKNLGVWIIIAMAIGIVVGIIMGPEASMFKPLGDLFIQLIKMLVVPLVLVSIISGAAALGETKSAGLIGGLSIGYMMVTTVISITIALLLGVIFQPGTNLEAEGLAAISEASEAAAESAAPAAEVKDPELTLKRVWDFAMTAPVEELRFILEAKRLNMNAAYESLKGEYGHAIGKLFRSESERNVMGDTLHCQIVGMTTAACDARMAGAMIPVMSNSGSGNQGLTSTVPVAVYAEQIGANEEQTIRSLILSNLTVIYIKQSLGRLSALCGCVVAATGSSCGITYLMGGGYQEVTYAVKNMIANLAGMICDGAKPSCAMKCASGVSTAVVSALMAMNNRCVKSVEGIIDDDVDKSIRNLTDIGRDAMVHTDAMILRIMTSK